MLGRETKSGFPLSLKKNRCTPRELNRFCKLHCEMNQANPISILSVHEKLSFYCCWINENLHKILQTVYVTVTYTCDVYMDMDMLLSCAQSKKAEAFKRWTNIL